MKITSLETIELRIPFEDGSRGTGIMPAPWTELDFALIKIETDTGLTGWGEGFGYFCNEAVTALINRTIAPILVGREFTNPEELCEEIQRKMVLQGRYGISTFALSGVDIALWDLAAKAEQVSIGTLLSAKPRTKIPAYASLVRYDDGDLVTHYSTAALEEGYSAIKLHEIDLSAVRTCHKAVGGDADVIVDVNCNWSEEFTREAIPELKELNTYWLEEPVFPPEDFSLLRDLRKTGMPIAAGENVCTAVQFGEMMRYEAIDFIQPSITKVGGITEFNKIRALNRKYRYPMMPHSPYFGPGYLATLQMAAAEESFELFEFLYIRPEVWLYKEMPLPEKGSIRIPEGYGLGLEPDPEILERYHI
ncbi:MAG: mandelate racemase/muconate lactonizing enzyme family protein [Spirochaetaceae bacterium]